MNLFTKKKLNNLKETDNFGDNSSHTISKSVKKDPHM